MNGWVWGDLSRVRPGDYVLDPDGAAQKVLGRDSQRADQVMLINAAGDMSLAPQAGPVQVWDGPMQNAIAIIAHELGGRVVADSSLTR